MKATAIAYKKWVETHVSGHGLYRTEHPTDGIPKYSCRILNPGVKAHVPKLFPKALEMILECEMVEQNVRKDHLLRVMAIPLRYPLSNMEGQIKSVTSKYQRRRFS